MRRKEQQTVTVGFVALGCPKNIVDSERMLAEIAQAGYHITAEAENADVVVINTCGFIAPAKAEALRAIKHAVNSRRSGTAKKIIVAGCLPQRLGADLLELARGVDAIVGLDRREDIVPIIRKTVASAEPASYLESPIVKPARPKPPTLDDRTRLLITPPHWAYLRISEGCNHKCSFCTIPAIRGPFRSKPRQLILAEARELVAAGVVELNIIGQDTTYYGRDLNKRNALASLLKELEKIPGLAWVRLMYTYPAEISKPLIAAIAESKKIVHYIDMPLQHINSRILKAMRRPANEERICALIETLRSAIPDIILRSTFIVGFPGETDRQFKQLLKFVKWARFDALGCFKFYPESGTPAVQMPGRVPEHIKRRRIKQLMLTQQEIAFDKNKQRIGSTLKVLVDSVDAKKKAKTRFYGQAPHIDSVCIVRNCSAPPGAFINAKVTAVKNYDLIAEQI